MSVMPQQSEFRVVKTVRIDGNERPAGVIDWSEVRLIERFSIKLPVDDAVADHGEMIGEGNEGGLVETRADNPSGLVVGKLDHHDQFAVDHGAADLNVTVRPDFDGFHVLLTLLLFALSAIAEREPGANRLEDAA